MPDIVREIEAVTREVGEGQLPAGTGRMVRLQRDYAAPIDEVWDALTDPERLTRWFLPVSGDYRIGGRYQFEGNAGGEILACERPDRLRVSWEYGGGGADASQVEVRLAAIDDRTTRFVLEHVAIVPDDAWSQFGPGAVGVGWDGGLLGLELHLRGGSVGDPIAWQMSAEGRSFNMASSASWGAANLASGAGAEVAALGVTNTNAFYAPEPDAAP